MAQVMFVKSKGAQQQAMLRRRNSSVINHESPDQYLMLTDALTTPELSTGNGASATNTPNQLPSLQTTPKLAGVLNPTVTPVLQSVGLSMLPTHDDAFTISDPSFPGTTNKEMTKQKSGGGLGGSTKKTGDLVGLAEMMDGDNNHLWKLQWKMGVKNKIAIDYVTSASHRGWTTRRYVMLANSAQKYWSEFAQACDMSQTPFQKAQKILGEAVTPEMALGY
ncbi:hypothetical protein RFI_05314, partial [Reticulomyxa filosa]